jgi:CheY-like chemotaxis protein
MAGLEIISELATEGVLHLQSGKPLEMKFVNDMLITTLQCVRNIRNTNNFMLMTINRCIDYTKASKGLKLQPRMETIDLHETLSLPLNCMKDIQNRINISMVPYNEDEICSHVITDKQWLQENILCLLSNAVKYSSSGEVSVRVLLLESNTGPMERLASQPVVGAKSRSYKGRNSVAPWSEISYVRIEEGLTNTGDSDSILRSPSVTTNNLKASSSSILAYCQTQNPNRMLLFEVEDTGIGMSEQAMRSLFSPFQQTQSLAGGTGLGLYSLSKRIEALHGKCGVQKRRDMKQGSLFWFTIPYRPDESTAKRRHTPIYLTNKLAHMNGQGSRSQSMDLSANPGAFPYHNVTSLAPQEREMESIPESSLRSPSSEPVDAVPPSSFPSKVEVPPPALPSPTVDMFPTKRRILLVDDSPSVQKMTSMLLRRQGFDVTTAENGAHALEVIQKALEAKKALLLKQKDFLQPLQQSKKGLCLACGFDIILMDLQMPVMDGLEAVKRLREIEKTACPFNTNNPLHHTVIGVSANSDEETQQETIAIGFDGFISKPFSMQTFQDLLEKVGVLAVD